MAESRLLRALNSGPATPSSPFGSLGLGYSDFARHYFRNHGCFLFLQVLRWFTSDRKSTRLNSSHLVISYAVFCLKKQDAVHQRFAQHHRKQRHNRNSHVLQRLASRSRQLHHPSRLFFGAPANPRVPPSSPPPAPKV